MGDNSTCTTVVKLLHALKNCIDLVHNTVVQCKHLPDTTAVTLNSQRFFFTVEPFKKAYVHILTPSQLCRGGRAGVSGRVDMRRMQRDKRREQVCPVKEKDSTEGKSSTPPS